VKIEEIDLQSAKAVKTMIEEEQLKFTDLTNNELKIALHCCNWMLDLHDRMEKSFKEVTKAATIKTVEDRIIKKTPKPKKEKASK
jgi:hypothetical protein